MQLNLFYSVYILVPASSMHLLLFSYIYFSCLLDCSQVVGQQKPNVFRLWNTHTCSSASITTMYYGIQSCCIKAFSVLFCYAFKSLDSPKNCMEYCTFSCQTITPFFYFYSHFLVFHLICKIFPSCWFVLNLWLRILQFWFDSVVHSIVKSRFVGVHGTGEKASRDRLDWVSTS